MAALARMFQKSAKIDVKKVIINGLYDSLIHHQKPRDLEVPCPLSIKK